MHFLAKTLQRFERYWLPLLNGWIWLVVAIAIAIAMPVLVVLSSIFYQTPESRKVWTHLSSTVLPEYILNSFWLMVGVGIGVLTIGVGTAWLVTMCRFPGSRIFEWALLLPLAAPAYLLAYTYTEVLEFYGPVQGSLRALFGWESLQDYWFPDVRSLGGAIAMLSLVLYPYVYLLSRVAFLEQSASTLEASRSLGCSPWRSFFTIALPLARPAIAAGTALALMETLNDFGTVQFFGVNTFTTGIYRTWLGMGQRVSAAQLASLLMLFIFVLVVLERFSRRQARYYQSNGRYQPLQRYELGRLRAFLAQMACFLPLALGLLVPAGVLLEMTLAHASETIDEEFWQLAGNSLFLATVSAAIAVLLATIMAYGVRLNPNFGMRLSVRVASMGYAIPGSVIAVGILIPMGQFDNWLDRWMSNTFGISTGLLLSGTVVALILAYLVRFLAVSFNTIESSLAKIKPTLDDAARSLGRRPSNTLVEVHAPLMLGSLLTAGMLVFVDVMKELPATMVIRPFDFDTLAVRVHRYAADERLVEAAGPALAIILVGILPVILLSIQIARSRLK